MNVQPDVGVSESTPLASVHADTDPDLAAFRPWLSSEDVVHADRRPNRVGSRCERGEEAVALGTDLAAARGLEHVADQLGVALEDAG